MAFSGGSNFSSGFDGGYSISFDQNMNMMRDTGNFTTNIPNPNYSVFDQINMQNRVDQVFGDKLNQMNVDMANAWSSASQNATATGIDIGKGIYTRNPSDFVSGAVNAGMTAKDVYDAFQTKDKINQVREEWMRANQNIPPAYDNPAEKFFDGLNSDIAMGENLIRPNVTLAGDMEGNLYAANTSPTVSTPYGEFEQAPYVEMKHTCGGHSHHGLCLMF